MKVTASRSNSLETNHFMYYATTKTINWYSWCHVIDGYFQVNSSYTSIDIYLRDAIDLTYQPGEATSGRSVYQSGRSYSDTGTLTYQVTGDAYSYTWINPAMTSSYEAYASTYTYTWDTGYFGLNYQPDYGDISPLGSYTTKGSKRFSATMKSFTYSGNTSYTYESSVITSNKATTTGTSTKTYSTKYG